MSKEITFMVTTGYGANTRKAFVQLEIENQPKDHPIQLEPDAARDLALNLLEAAEGAEGDAFIFEFVEQDLKQNQQAAAGIMLAFRKWRGAKSAKPPGHGHNVVPPIKE